MGLFSKATLILGEMRFEHEQTSSQRATGGDDTGTEENILKLHFSLWLNQLFLFIHSFIHSFLSRVLSVNTSFIMRRRQRKCWFRENIKKSAAGGKQSEEGEEEMLRGYESDRGRKTKECQEGWGGGTSLTIPLLRRPPRTPGAFDGRIRDKRERKQEIHPSANEIWAVREELRSSWVSLHY